MVGKKPKFSVGDMGIDSSSGVCVVVQSSNVQDGVANCEGKLVSEKAACIVVGEQVM